MNHHQPFLITPQPAAAIYARVSGERQAKEGTVASQVEALRQRVRDDGLPLDQAMCFIDDGHSGASLARPALEALRDAAVEARIQRLYVHSPDRLARDFVDQMVLVDELRRCGVELVFVNRALGDSPED
jgi:site-specific DNA recombinase